jgi:hypothetical protein
MKISFLLGLAFSASVSLAAVGCSTAAGGLGTAEPAHSGTPGSHVGVHGMVLFGHDKIYVSHIPTFGAPHNFQGVLEVAIESGVPSTSQSFSDELYTIRPSSMSLYDLLHGTLKSFTGTIFKGNFEAGGRPVFRNVKFAVKRLLLERPLSPSTPASADLRYLAVGTAADPYLVHLLDAPSTFDQIVGVGPIAGLDDAALESGVTLVVDGDNTVAGRLQSTASAHLVAQRTTDAGDGGAASELELKFRQEYSCLTGPEFFEACE